MRALILVLLVAAGAFIAAWQWNGSMEREDSSRLLTVKSPVPISPAGIATPSSQLETRAATPQPAADPIPTPSTTPEPLEFDIAALVQDRSRWPAQITLTGNESFPAVLNGRVVGHIQVPAGTIVRLLGVRDGTVVVDYQGGRKELRTDATDIAARVLAAPSPRAATPPPRPLVATTPRSFVSPLESIRYKPDSFSAATHRAIREHLRLKIAASGVPVDSVDPLDPDVEFSYYEAAARFDALSDQPDSLPIIAALALYRADQLLAANKPGYRLRGLYLAAVTADRINKYAPEKLLTSAIFDVYLTPNIEAARPEPTSWYLSRGSMLDSWSSLLDPDDITRKLLFFDLRIRHAWSASDRDRVIYLKAHALRKEKRFTEALAELGKIRQDGEMAWMLPKIRSAWNTESQKWNKNR